MSFSLNLGLMKDCRSFFKSLELFLLKKMAGVFPDRIYLKCLYRIHLGRRLDLDHPLFFTEKLQWLKLYYHRPECTEMVDKYAAKFKVERLVGSEFVIPTLGVWSSADDIDFASLPDRFVLKCTHDSGGVVICKDKAALDECAVRDRLDRCLKRDYYVRTREWPYRNVPRRIIAEPYLEDESGELTDYKFMCFDGVPKVMFVAANRSSHKTFDYYDMDFRPLPIESRYGARTGKLMAKPDAFDEMKRIASVLSAGFPHVRVDLYCVENHVYWGELTFFDSNGLDDMKSLEWDRRLGEWLHLPDSKIE